MKGFCFTMCAAIARFTIFLCIFSIGHTQELPAKESSMVFYEIETGQVLYETTAPIIFDFKVPDWLDESTLSISNNCSSENQSKQCSLLFHINQVGEQLRSAMFSNTFSLPDTTQSTWGLKCGVLSKHFSSFKVAPDVAVRYMEFLRYCSRKMILEMKRDNKYSSSFRNTYGKMLENYNQSYFQQPSTSYSPSNEIMTEKELLLSETTFISMGFIQFLSESQRWKDAFLSCKSGLIPESLITHEMFYSALYELNSIVASEKHRFVIPAQEGFLPFYFKAPIADCTIANQGLLVRILVPVVKMESEWMHISVQSIPFRSHRQMQNPEDPADLIGYIQEHEFRKTYFYERSSKSLFVSECDISQPLFCRLPQKTDSERLTRKSCASALITNDVNDEYLGKVIRACPIMWEHQTNIHFPILRLKSTNTFYIVSGVSDKILIKCPNEERTFNSTGYGAMEIILPCQCTLILNDEMFMSQLPCGDTLSVERLYHPYPQNNNGTEANNVNFALIFLVLAVFCKL